MPDTPFQGLIDGLAATYGTDPTEFVKAVKSCCFPDGSASDPQLFVFLSIARELDLNPFNREIAAFVSKSNGKMQVIVMVDGWIKLVNRQKVFQGFEFIDVLDADGKLAAVTCRMYRSDWSRTGEATEYLMECYQPESTIWKKWPRRMLRNKAYIQCARVTFGFAGIIEPDENERIEHPENWRETIDEETGEIIRQPDQSVPGVKVIEHQPIPEDQRMPNFAGARQAEPVQASKRYTEAERTAAAQSPQDQGVKPASAESAEAAQPASDGGPAPAAECSHDWKPSGVATEAPRCGKCGVPKPDWRPRGRPRTVAPAAAPVAASSPNGDACAALADYIKAHNVREARVNNQLTKYGVESVTELDATQAAAILKVFVGMEAK